MLFCSITTAFYNLLGDLGLYNLPFIGDTLQNVISSINDFIGCH